MPFIFTSNATQSGIHANMGTAVSETTYVGGNATLVGTASNPIVQGSGAGQSVIIQGELFAAGASAISLSGQDGAVEIGAKAAVRSSASSHRPAVSIAGANSSLMNAGTIGGARGVWMGGDGTRLYNTGTITGIGESDTTLAAGIQLGAGLGSTGTATMQIVNHGLIMGETWSIDDAQVFRRDGVDYDYGVTALIIENHGTLQGHVRTEGGDDAIYNSGFIVGDVWLGAGADRYDGRHGGLVSGTVGGGAGDDWLRGGATGDILVGDGGSDTLLGFDGDDTIHGGDGGDTLGGGRGDDWIEGGNGGDLIRGGEGHDTILAGTDGSADTVYGGHGDDSIETGAGHDSVYGGQGDDTIWTGEGDDFVWAGGGDDWIDLGEGTDVAYGCAGNDTIIGHGGGPVALYGGEGDDLLQAMAFGWDTLNGGRGNDTLSGGGGKDIFIFGRDAGHDVITDFQNGPDTIDLSAYGISFAKLNGAGAISGDAGTTVINLSLVGGSGSITMENFAVTDLNNADFLF